MTSVNVSLVPVYAIRLRSFCGSRVLLTALRSAPASWRWTVIRMSRSLTLFDATGRLVIAGSAFVATGSATDGTRRRVLGLRLGLRRRRRLCRRRRRARRIRRERRAERVDQRVERLALDRLVPGPEERVRREQERATRAERLVDDRRAAVQPAGADRVDLVAVGLAAVLVAHRRRSRRNRAAVTGQRGRVVHRVAARVAVEEPTLVEAPRDRVRRVERRRRTSSPAW